MRTSNGGFTRNQILSRLSRADLDLVLPHLSPVELPLRKSLEASNKTIDYVYFIERGFASVVANGPDGVNIEVGLIGGEGMTGLAVVLGLNRSTNATYMQMAGQGLRMSAGNLRSAIEKSASLQKILLQYCYVFMVQTSQTALANGHGLLEQRLARWLLMAQDRVNASKLVLTHELLAVMLGVRRPGVTAVITILADRGFVRASRGAITILNRKGLEKAAGGRYGVPEAEFTRLFG